jgi:predicted permease
LAGPGDREQVARFAREARLELEPGATGVLSGFRETYRRGLRLLLMMLAAVLLIASLNVATLLLARSEARRREFITRLSLGAGRGRLIQQLLTESILLAGLGGAFGLALAWWGSRVLLRIALPNAVTLPVNITPDARVIAFTLAVSALTCLVFGLLPALRATSGRLGPGTRELGRSRRLVDQALVATQVAVTLVLLVGAGLFLRSLGKLWSQDTGYDRRNVLMFSLDLSLAGRKSAQPSATYRKLLDDLRAQPGAVSASASVVRPVDDDAYYVGSFTKPGESPDRRVRVAHNLIAPDYFATLGIPLLAGRDFDYRDESGGLRSVIVSETLAKRHFPDRSPVGQTIQFNGVREIVGVAKDTRYGNVKDAPREVIYRPLFEQAGGGPISYEVRFRGSAASMEQSVRALVAKVDPSLSVFRIKTLEMQTAESLSRERLLALLTSYFGGFALMLASIGLYGLVSYGVTQRTPEIGLRMALGARPSTVQRMVFSESFRIVLCGVAVGLAAALGVVNLLRTQLYGIEPYDPAAMIGATLLLVAITFLASVLPALRAARIDPMRALRCE